MTVNDDANRTYMRRRRHGISTKGISRRGAEKAPFWGAHAKKQEPQPDHVLADAQFRNAIPDPLFGDPKPGQSALDKRQR